ncbi:MAG: N-6 DNA methylase [Rhodocyclaceae bacterium]|nr:N-6 DNA methylase [Rhodocyclaceae bacterium]
MLPRDKLSYYSRLSTLRHLVSSSTGHSAKEIVIAVLVLVIWARFPKLSKPKANKALLQHPAVAKFAEWLISLPLFDLTFWLSSSYAGLVDDAARKQKAMFFTPPELAERLINSLIAQGGRLLEGQIIDPACGGAAFLAPAASRIAEHLESKGNSSRQILEQIETKLTGIDVEPFLCALSNYFIQMVLYKHIEVSDYRPKLKINVGNALARHQKLYGAFDLVLCNPPYRKMKTEEVCSYTKSYGDILEGQPNLYGLFFKLSLKLCKRDGLAGLVTPISFLSGRDFSKLRTYLLGQAEARQIDLVSNKMGVFVGVEQEAAISILSRQAPRKDAPSQTKVFVLGKVNGFELLGTCALPNSGLAWPVPRAVGDVEILATTHGSQVRLADYGYRVRIGALVWNRDKRKRYSTEKQAKKAKAAFPLVWSSDIGQDGHFVFTRHKDRRQSAFIDMGFQDSSSVIRQPCVALQRVTSNDQPRRLVAAPISQKLLKEHGGVVGENHVVFLEQVGKNPVLTPTQLAKVLRSKPIDRLFRCISGANNISAFELSQLPLPEPAALVRELSLSEDIDIAVQNAFKANRG